MTREEKAEIVARIEDEIEKTRIEIGELRELTKPIPPENAIGRVSRMDAINNRSVNESRLRKAEEKLRKLKHALTNSQHEKFGTCGRCGHDIQLGRLMLLPESNHCIRCAR